MASISVAETPLSHIRSLSHNRRLSSTYYILNLDELHYILRRSINFYWSALYCKSHAKFSLCTYLKLFDNLTQRIFKLLISSCDTFYPQINNTYLQIDLTTVELIKKYRFSKICFIKVLKTSFITEIIKIKLFI